MKPSRNSCSWVCAVTLLGVVLVTSVQVNGQAANIRYAKQGFSMRLCFDNRGTMGRVSYPGGIGGVLPCDSLGLEYPIGHPYEHIFGAGMWIGGKLDTAQTGTSTPIKLVSTAYEGWAGPYFELYPGSSVADSIWEVTGRGISRPPSWNAYWGNAIPQLSFSDNDHYCTYTDTAVRVTGHIPLRLKIVQSSFVWNHPYAEAIHVVEYKIINSGVKQIDSAYVGLFLEGDVGPACGGGPPYYYQRNYTGYFSDSRTAYIHNPVDIGSTPVGLTVVHASRPLDSLRYAFRWWPGPQHPPTDAFKYAVLASGQIDSNQSLSNLSDTRCLIAFGPFTLRPPGGSVHDTVVVVFTIVSGQNLTVMRQHAERAKDIYLSGGLVSVNGGHDQLPEHVELLQNYPNPFNPMTTIQFNIPHPVSVNLRVYDILGAEVATLVSAELPAGQHAVRWDASNMPSGVYFYRLESGMVIETKKIVLLR